MFIVGLNERQKASQVKISSNTETYKNIINLIHLYHHYYVRNSEINTKDGEKGMEGKAHQIQATSTRADVKRLRETMNPI